MRIALLLGLCLLAGCARDEFDLTQPADLKARIGRDDRVAVYQPPLTYGLLADHDRLNLRIDNPTTQPVTLRADQSYAVDAGGQSRRVPGLTIAPGSFAQFLLPPPRPYVDDSGVTVGMGFDTAGGFRNGAGWNDAYYGGPRSIGGLDENVYWQWPRDGTVKFHFVFESGGSTWANDLTLKRVKS